MAWFAWDYYNTGTKPPVIGSALTFPNGNPDISEDPVSDEQRREHTAPAHQPRYISVPSLGLHNVRVFAVGLTPEGAIDSPRNIYDAAWFDQSALPGDGDGVVLIDAHNGGTTQNGIFTQLNKLQTGDIIIIERGDGEKISYEVMINKTMSLEEANTDGMKEIAQPVVPDKEGLGLITCAGTYIPRAGLYDQRVMVRATRVE